MATHIDYDTINRIMYVTTAPVGGTLTLDVAKDIYSAAKYDWKVNSTLNKFKFPFYQPVGGNTIIPNVRYLGKYVFLKFGWLMRPYEADHTLYLINAYLLVDGGGDPWLKTQGGYTVNVRDTVPADAFALETGTSGLTQQESDALLNIKNDQSTINTNISTINTNISSINVSISSIDASIVDMETELKRALGLMQENIKIDQQQYTVYQGQSLLTSARLRLYNKPVSQATGADLVATYQATAQWSGQQQVEYICERVYASTTTTTSTTTTSTTTTI